MLIGVLSATLCGLCVAALSEPADGLLSSTPRGRLGRIPSPDVPEISESGYCDLPSQGADGVTNITCYGPRHLLRPGQASNIVTRLDPNPFPEVEQLLLLSQSMQVVNDSKQPVPLTEVYFHHYASSFRYLGTSGAEFRGQIKPFPAPYAQVLNGSFLADREWRKINIEFINQLGVALEDRQQCLECWCDETAQGGDVSFAPTETVNGFKVPVTRVGSFLCCRQCPSSRSHEEPRGYRMQYSLSYRPLTEQDDVVPLGMIPLYSSGWGNTEYQIPEALGPNSTHVEAFDTVIDQLCPQNRTLRIVRCQAHQHIGAKCMTVIDLSNNHTICRSCPILGTEPDVPGNELGFVVHEEEYDPSPPYALEPGTKIRIQAEYDASKPRFGVMSFLFAWLAGMDYPCRAEPGPDVPAEKYLPLGPRDMSVYA